MRWQSLSPLALPAFAAAALVALADQVAKEIVSRSLAYGEVVPLTGFFNLVYFHNRGAAFGMFASGGWLGFALLAFGIAAMLVVSVLLLRAGRDRWTAAGLALILGGASGNVIDRFRLGAVVDWLDFYAGTWHWPAFNLADSALTLGVVLFLLADVMAKRASFKQRSSKA